jgi:hypothetical protein
MRLNFLSELFRWYAPRSAYWDQRTCTPQSRGLVHRGVGQTASHSECCADSASATFVGSPPLSREDKLGSSLECLFGQATSVNGLFVDLIVRRHISANNGRRCRFPDNDSVTYEGQVTKEAWNRPRSG